MISYGRANGFIFEQGEYRIRIPVPMRRLNRNLAIRPPGIRDEGSSEKSEADYVFWRSARAELVIGTIDWRPANFNSVRCSPACQIWNRRR